jgi:hypothetical protein
MTEVEKYLERFGRSITSEMRTRLTNLGKSATGDLINSITYQRQGNNLNILMSDYAVYVNNGRRPGGRMPPPGSLDTWLRARGIPQEADYPIRRAIAERGIKPTNFLATTIGRRQKEFENGLANAFAADVEKQIRKEIK